MSWVSWADELASTLCKEPWSCTSSTMLRTLASTSSSCSVGFTAGCSLRPHTHTLVRCLCTLTTATTCTEDCQTLCVLECLVPAETIHMVLSNTFSC